MLDLFPSQGTTAVTPFGTMWPFGGASPFAHMNAMVRNMVRVHACSFILLVTGGEEGVVRRGW